MDTAKIFGAKRNRWLTPAALVVGIAICFIYWDNVSESLRLVEDETDRRGAAASQLLARTAGPHMGDRGTRGLRDALRWLRESDPDAASGAVFGPTGRMIRTNDPYYFNGFPANALGISTSARALRHDGYDAFVTPITDYEGRRTGYAAVRVSRDRLTRLALDAVRRTIMTALGVAAVLLLALHLLMRRVDAFALELDCRVQERTHDLSEANRSLGAEIQRREAAQEDLARARDEALRTAKVKSEFVAKMSHEIRTPISGVIGMNDVLMASGLSEEQFEYAATVKRCAESLLAVINDILDFSKIEAGKLQLDAVDFSPSMVAEEVCELMAVSARRKGLELACVVSPAVPVLSNGDPQRLRQVLMNLVGNAIKFTEAGEVIVECWPGQEAGALLFSVSDTGIGVSAESRKTVFDDYVQADGSHSRRFGGTGLGLAISRSLVEKMGGSIGLEPRPAGGTRFWFSVRTQPARDGVRPVLPAMTPRRALVIESHEPSRRSASQSLLALGAEVESFDGQPASLGRLWERLVSGKAFDVVLVDARMSGPDGGSMAGLLKTARATANARLVAAAYVSDLPSLRERLEAYDGWVRKPVRPAELRAVMEARRPAAATAPAQAPVAVFPGRRVLLAEDNPVNARVAIAQLRGLGVETVWVQDGKQALEKLAEGGFDLALMDCQMAEMDGYTATTQWREREGATGRLPIIALTAHAMLEERARCLAAGMDDHLSKPVTKARLSECLRRWLNDWDEAAFREIADVDRTGEVGADLIGGFLSRAPGRLLAMRRHAANGDDAGVRREAHALRGDAGFAGAKRLQSLCAVVDDAPEGTAIASAGLLLALDSSFDAARKRIAQGGFK